MGIPFIALQKGAKEQEKQAYGIFKQTALVNDYCLFSAQAFDCCQNR
jgi:hypothetical protein